MSWLSRKKGPAPVGDLGWEQVRTMLRPRLVGVQVEAVRALALPEEVRSSAQIASAPVAGDVAVGVVVESEDGLAQVGPGLLATWGQTLADALDVAVASTFDRDVEIAQLVEGTYVVRDPWFAAALAQRPAMSATFEVVGDVVVVFADAGCILVSGSQDVEGLTIVGDLLDDLVSVDEKPVSVTPLHLVDGAWQVLELPAAVAESPGWRMAVRRWTTHRAEQQAGPLAALLASQGRDVAVAPVNLVRDTQGRALTYSAVTEGVPTAVAATDSVAHVGLDGSTRLRELADVLDGAEQLADVTPPRWVLDLGAPGDAPEA